MADLRTGPTTPEAGARADGLTCLYLSGGARVSTRLDTESLGPRSHIVGVIEGLRQEGVGVETLIVGDRTARLVSGPGTDRWLQSGPVSRLAADAGRFSLNWRTRREVAGMLDRSRFDFVYERNSLFQDLGVEAVRRKVPWVLEVNALLSIESSRHRRATTSLRLARRVERESFHRADLLVSVSEPLADMMVDFHGIPRDRILVLPNGVDVERFERCTPVEPTGKHLTLGFVGALYPWQDLETLLHAIKRDTADRLRVRIAGDGVAGPRLRAVVDELDLNDRVELVGRVAPENIPDFLQSVDLGFAGHNVASGTYFSPLKIWEYLAAARPVLASAHATTESLRADGLAVELFRAGDLDDLCGALERCLAARADLARRAATTRELVGAGHSWRVRVRTLLDDMARRGLVRNPSPVEAEVNDD